MYKALVTLDSDLEPGSFFFRGLDEACYGGSLLVQTFNINVVSVDGNVGVVDMKARSFGDGGAPPGFATLPRSPSSALLLVILGGGFPY